MIDHSPSTGHSSRSPAFTHSARRGLIGSIFCPQRSRTTLFSVHSFRSSAPFIPICDALNFKLLSVSSCSRFQTALNGKLLSITNCLITSDFTSCPFQICCLRRPGDVVMVLVSSRALFLLFAHFPFICVCVTWTPYRLCPVHCTQLNPPSISRQRGKAKWNGGLGGRSTSRRCASAFTRRRRWSPSRR